MSGSGGGGYIPPQRNEFNCKTSAIISQVSSVDLVVLAKHNPGSILDVVLGDSEEVLIEDGDGEILGAILHANTPDLVDCINDGVDFKAEIQRIDSPVCVVKIKRQ